MTFDDFVSANSIFIIGNFVSFLILANNHIDIFSAEVAKGKFHVAHIDAVKTFYQYLQQLLF